MALAEDIQIGGTAARYRQLKELGDKHVAGGQYVKAKLCYESAAGLCPEQTDAYLGMGAVAMHDGDFSRAQGAFASAVAIDARCGEAHLGLAMIHQQRQEYSAAFDSYLKCLELDCDNLVALLGLFQASCQMGSFSQIIRYLEVYLRGHPTDTSVLFCLATLYAREGDLAKARRAALNVLLLEPHKAEAAELLVKVEAGLHNAAARACR